MRWEKRVWEGKLQYTNVPDCDLMMLPTDIALLEDPSFRVYVEQYARDEHLFFNDFAAAFTKLLSLGSGTGVCPMRAASGQASDEECEVASAQFREAAMHGHSVDTLRSIAKRADTASIEKSSGRNALHKAAFWGHDHTTKYLLGECQLNPDVQDYNGDTALHDAARFGHSGVIRELLCGNAVATLRNSSGETPLDCAEDHGQVEAARLLRAVGGAASTATMQSRL